MPSGWRHKDTHVRYIKVNDPHDPSGYTRVRTEGGSSSFKVRTDKLEYAPVDADLDTEHHEDDVIDMSQDMLEYATPQPVSLGEIAAREDEGPEEFDYIVLARQLPFNLGEAVKHIWLARHGRNNSKEHLRQARYHLSDEMQRVAAQ